MPLHPHYPPVNPPRILVYDQYTAAVAAGSLNGTAAEPTGAKRTVLDVNTKLSTTAGKLSAATGGSGNNDPSLGYLSIARVLGRQLMVTVTIGGVNAVINTGFASGPTSIPTTGIRISANTSQIIVHNNAQGTTIVVGASATSGTYTVATVLRTTGAWHFIKGQAFTNWTLIWVLLAGSNANRNPTIGAQSGVSPFTADEFIIPYRTYVPSPQIYQTFTGADSTTAIVNSDATGPDSQVLTPLVGTAKVGTWGIISNQGYCPTLSGGIGIYTWDFGKANIIYDAAITRAAGNVGVVLRYADSSNYIIAYTDGTNAKLDKVVAGVTTNVISAAVTYAAGNILRVICDGTSFRLFYNNLVVGAVSTISDAALQSPTLHGLYATDNGVGSNIDTLSAWARGNSTTEYAGLDTY